MESGPHVTAPPAPALRGRVPAALAAALLSLLAACGTTPHGGPGAGSHLPPGNAQRDGPDANPPANLMAVPDATPQIEAIRPGGPNKPYEIDGHTYTPLTEDRPVTERGLASWYGRKFQGHRTASGEAYNMYAMTAAHKTLPIPSYARVRNPANGREVIVRVNDRGPFASGRIIDLSYTAALKLGVLNGVQAVEIERITDDDIRTGAAFHHGSALAAAPAAAAAAPVVVASAHGRGALPAHATGDGRGLRAVPSAGAANAAPAAPVQALPPAPGDVLAESADAGMAGADAAARAAAPPVDLGAAAAADLLAGGNGDPPGAAADGPTAPLPPAMPTPPAAASPSATADPLAGVQTGAAAPLERLRAETAAGAGFWVQIGAYRDRRGALEFQGRLIDEQPWLAPLLAVFSERGLNKLQAGPYRTREDASGAAEHIRAALQLVPSIVERR